MGGTGGVGWGIRRGLNPSMLETTRLILVKIHKTFTRLMGKYDKMS